MRALAFAVLALMALAPAVARAEPDIPYIIESAVSGETLWVLYETDTEHGLLASVDLSTGQRSLRRAENVTEIVTRGGEVWAARRLGGRTMLSTWRDGAFVNIETPVERDLIALAADARGFVLAEAQRVHRYNAETGRWRSTRLRRDLESGGASAAVTADGARLYVGYARGEWGGGLVTIDIARGLVQRIERRDSDEICAGPLNSDCDPVTAVIPDPARAECVLAGVGLSHMMMNLGRVLRVCGREVGVVFEQPYDVGPVQAGDIVLNFPPGTEPILDVVPAPGGYWAVSYFAVYRSENGVVTRHDLPALADQGGVFLNRAAFPGLIVLAYDQTDAGEGYTPLLAAPN